MRKCAHCGRPFTVQGQKRFCSGLCRLRAFRRRHAGVAEDTPPLPGPPRLADVGRAALDALDITQDRAEASR